MRSSPRRRACVVVTVLACTLAGCTLETQEPGPSATTRPTAEPTRAPRPFQVAAPQAPAVVLDTTDPVGAALAASGAVFAAAPVVVLAGADDPVGQLTAASAAVALGSPLLLVGQPAADAPDPAATLRAELDRLGTAAALVVGPAAAPAGLETVRVPAGAEVATLAAATGRRFGAATPVTAGDEAAAVGALTHPRTAVLRAVAAASSGTTPSPSRSTLATGPTPAATALPALPATEPATTAPAATVALTGAGDVPLAVLATLRAAGVPLVDVPAADPRSTSEAVTALAAAAPQHVIGLGTAFGPVDRLASRVATAAAGAQLPGGGQLLFPQDLGLPGKRYVALYGTPGWPALGVLGEQDVPATIARAEAHAAPYRGLTTDTVIPGVEIIATIASAGAGPDGNYSNERTVDELMPLVQAAGEAGQTVVLDLQPGRTDFLTQAQQYQALLELPHVGLALDPEWRLGPDQVHLRQIGSVGIDEVNAVSAWLAELVRDHHLPQKMLIVHQFMLRMVGERERLDMSHDELAVVVHVDGQGSQGAKVGTWNTIRAGAPAGLHWGWKNFYDEDSPAMLDPAGTYAIVPTPDLVTYQ